MIFVWFFICWYLKLRFVLNTFLAKIPKSNHSAMEYRKRNQLEIKENRLQLELGHGQAMKTSCVLTKKFFTILFAIFCVFLLVFMNLTTVPIMEGHFIPINLETHEVWHHIHTIGVLVLRGSKRTLVDCRLILLEKG